MRKRFLPFLILPVALTAAFLFFRYARYQDGSAHIALLHGACVVGQQDWYPRFTFVAEGRGWGAGATLSLRVPETATIVPAGTFDDLVREGWITVTSPVPYAAETHPAEGGAWGVTVRFPAPFPRGGRFVLNFARPLPPLRAGRHPIEATLDADGDGTSAPVRGHPVIEIRPAIRLRVPNLVAPRTPFTATLEIDTGHPEAPFTGTLDLTSSDPAAVLPEALTLTPADRGHASFTARMATEGAMELIVTARSDPRIVQSVRVPVLSDPPPFGLYFGDTHGHTAFSDGQGTPEDYYRIGRDVEGLDFCILTDHDYLLSGEKWRKLQEIADRFDEPGRFVTMAAFEWSSKFGDKNVYLPGKARPLFPRNDPRSDHPEALFAAYRDFEALLIPHHPMSAFRPTDWRFHDPRLQRLVEIYSLHGRSEFYANPNPITPRTPPGQKYTTPQSVINVRGRSVQDALARGLRLGFIASGDKHDGHPGDLGLAGVYAATFDRRGIFDALYARRTFATTNARIVIDFRIDGEMMGRALVSDSPPRITARVIGTAPIRKLEVIRDNEVIHTKEGTRAFETLRLTDTPPPASVHFYYLRVTQRDGEMAWSSPIWLESPHPDLTLRETIRRKGGRVVLAIENRGGGRAGGSTLVVTDRPIDAAGERWRETIPLSSLAPGEQKTIELSLPSHRLPGEHEICALLDPHGNVAEADETNNRHCIRDLAADRVILDIHPPFVPHGKTRAPWQRFTFATQREKVRIEITARAGFHGVRGLNPKIRDDDLAFSIDGVDFGWDHDAWGEDRYTWDGAFLRGRAKTIVLERPFEAGEHEIVFRADGQPTLDRLRILGSGISFPSAALDAPRATAIPSDPRPELPAFTFEDKVVMWRTRLDDRHVAFHLLWSKNYPFTSNERERERWFRGEVRVVDAGYTLSTLDFAEESDHLVDDRRGTISFVARADKPCGIEMIFEIDPAGESAVWVDLFNGGVRRPEWTWLGATKLSRTHLGPGPWCIALSRPLTPPTQATPLRFEARNAVSLTERGGDLRDVRKRLAPLDLRPGDPLTQIDHLEAVVRRKPQEVRWRNDLARLLLESGAYDRAATQIEGAISEGVANATTWTLFADLAVARGAAKTRLPEMEAAASRFSSSGEFLRALARLQIAAGEPRRAEATLGRITDRSEPATWLVLARARMAAGALEAAGEAYRQAERLAPYDPRIPKGMAEVLLALGDPAGALEAIGQARMRGAPPGAIDLLAAEAHEAQGAFEKALEAYERAASVEKFRITARLRAARLQRRRGKIEAGIAILEGAVREGLRDPDLLLTLGNFHFATKAFEPARRAYEAALELDPTSAKAHEKVGKAWYRLEQPEKARPHLEKALELGSTSESLRFVLAEIEMSEGHPARARRLLEEIRARHPENLRALAGIGRSYLQERNLDAAMRIFQEVIRIAPRDPVGYYHLAQVERLRDAPAEAEKLWRVCLDLDPRGKYGARARRWIDSQRAKKRKEAREPER